MIRKVGGIRKLGGADLTEASHVFAYGVSKTM